jgi:hypothetical protein
MFASLEKSTKLFFVPSGLCNTFTDHSGNPVDISIQMDAHEYFLLFFQKIEEAFRGTKFEYILTNQVQMKMRSLMRCQDKVREGPEDANIFLALPVKGIESLTSSLDQLIRVSLLIIRAILHESLTCSFMYYIVYSRRS